MKPTLVSYCWEVPDGLRDRWVWLVRWEHEDGRTELVDAGLEDTAERAEHCIRQATK